ncbi:MAG: hypothetical protein A4E58_01470 [Syntrophorhabdus sp. PtaB.Bin006]|nr:MAG: hypothetical protein A4E58_01470 [Syntrophorhabdus sp. PtaB.Bin006]
MFHVRYVLSFDFLWAVQSTCRTVYCCPGALAAYRASVVRQVLEPWMNQTFLGTRCTLSFFSSLNMVYYLYTERSWLFFALKPLLFLFFYDRLIVFRMGLPPLHPLAVTCCSHQFLLVHAFKTCFFLRLFKIAQNQQITRYIHVLQGNTVVGWK